MQDHPIATKGLKIVRSALVFLFSASVTTRADTMQQCIDNAVIACFDGCTNPLNLQECIIGCSAGGSNDPQRCKDNCFGDTFCEGKCLQSVRAVANCAYVTGSLQANCGTIVLNRANGIWQQAVRISNTSTTDTWDNIGFVLDSLAPGWKLLNGDGVTSEQPPSGSPYKNIGSLAPGASTTVTLQFSRTGTLPFGYITRVVTGSLR